MSLSVIRGLVAGLAIGAVVLAVLSVLAGAPPRLGDAEISDGAPGPGSGEVEDAGPTVQPSGLPRLTSDTVPARPPETGLR